MTAATISPDFKSFVAETLRMQADTQDQQHHHAEAERLRQAAERLERQHEKEHYHVHA